MCVYDLCVCVTVCDRVTVCVCVTVCVLGGAVQDAMRMVHPYAGRKDQAVFGVWDGHGPHGDTVGHRPRAVCRAPCAVCRALCGVRRVPCVQGGCHC